MELTMELQVKQVVPHAQVEVIVTDQTLLPLLLVPQEATALLAPCTQLNIYALKELILTEQEQL